jgi:alkanesulfonate monooxygenase SsuD/methylene tetrahydromethanopterin reductase-like flavin-dependent oxidoreductase (luciferase family)
MAASLDVLSNGRLELGLGAGWRGSEQVSYGLPWVPSTKARVQMLVEAIEIIKGMWSNDTFTYTGTYYHVTDAVCNPKPVQEHPKIWLGGSGEMVVLKAIAKYADAWNIGEFSPEEYARKLRVLRSHCESAGTDYERVEKSLETVLLITDKKKDLARVVEWSNWFAKIQGEYSEEEKPAVGGLEDMKTRYILGTVTEVAERISEYVRAGVQQFMIYFLDFPSMNSARLLAEEVMTSL